MTAADQHGPRHLQGQFWLPDATQMPSLLLDYRNPSETPAPHLSHLLECYLRYASENLQSRHPDTTLVHVKRSRPTDVKYAEVVRGLHVRSFAPGAVPEWRPGTRAHGAR